MAQSPWEVFKSRGNSFFASGKYDEAIAEYSRAIQLNSDVSVLFSNRALSHLKLARYDHAELDAERAATLQASNHKAHYVLGRCRSQRREHTAACRSYQRCMELVRETNEVSKGMYTELFRYYYNELRLQHHARHSSYLQTVRDRVSTISSPHDWYYASESLISAMEATPTIALCDASFEDSTLTASRRIEVAQGSIPDAFLCPITLEVMRDPVMVIGTENPELMCSHVSYERAAILMHFSRNGAIDPSSRVEYRPRPTLIPNLALRNSIHSFLESHPWLYDE